MGRRGDCGDSHLMRCGTGGPAVCIQAVLAAVRPCSVGAGRGTIGRSGRELRVDRPRQFPRRIDRIRVLDQGAHRVAGYWRGRDRVFAPWRAWHHGRAVFRGRPFGPPDPGSLRPESFGPRSLMARSLTVRSLRSRWASSVVTGWNPGSARACPARPTRESHPTLPSARPRP